MKFIMLLLITVALHWSTAGLAQQVSFTGKNVSLQKIFAVVEQQTGFVVLGSSKLYASSKPVTVDARNVSLGEFLDVVLRDQPFTYTLKNKNILLTAKKGTNGGEKEGNLQESLEKVSGVVKNDDGMVLVGATVRVKKKGLSTTTDEEGRFVLNANKGDTLSISYVGFEAKEYRVDGSFVSVELVKAEKSMEAVEVVSTGYQNIPKERVTGSFTFVDNRALNQQVGSNILDRLNGIASGTLFDTKRVSIGNKRLGVTVRGLSTINGPADPLVVVDNFPYEGDINNINPNDIENITILKDAAAASIWGSRAGNGVIVITTKKAKLNQSFRVEVSSNVTVVEKPDLFSLQRMNSTDIIDVETFLFDKKFKFSDTAWVPALPFSGVYEILFKRKSGLITASDSAQQIDALRKVDFRNEFSKYMYRQAINQQYAINLRGGSSNSAWYMSAGYDKNINELYDQYKRINLRLENTFTPLKNLFIRSSIYYTNSQNTDGRTSYDEIVTASGMGITPYFKFYDDNGKANPFAINYRQKYLDTAGGGKLQDWNYYPATDYQYRSNKSELQDFLGNIAIAYKIGNFDFDVKYQYERQQTDANLIYNAQSFFARDLVNRFSSINRTIGVVSYKIPKGGIRDHTNRNVQNHSFRGQLNYNKNWGRGSVAAIAGVELRQVHTTGDSYRAYGYNNDLLSFSNVDYATQYPDYATGASVFIPNFMGFDDIVNRFVSTYANASYTWDRKYTISASGRRDASNLFGVNTNDKWTPLWSAGVSWDISGESFYKFSLLPYLKMRATYGFQGNVDQSLSAVTTIAYTSSLNPFTLHPVSSVQNFYNPDLRWEKIGTTNLGVDFALKSNMVTGTIDLYKKDARDLFGLLPVDPTAGLVRTEVTRNAGRLETKGIELLINSLNIDRKFKWSTTFIFNHNKDKIVDYYFGSTGVLAATSGKAVEKGRSVYGLYSYKWAGLDPLTGEPRGFLNGAISKSYSAITSADRPVSDFIYHGSDLPTTYGSLINTFSFKGISISALISYRLGYYFRRSSVDYSNLYSSLIGHSDYYNRWQKPGDELITNVPSMNYPTTGGSFYKLSEVLVEKADNIRLQYINLSYQFQPAILKRISMNRLEAFVNISNPGIIWKANNKGVDPDNPNIALPKRIAFGITAAL